MLAWFVHMVQIAIVGFVGYWITVGVDRRQIAQMIAVVAIILALYVTIEDITPVVKRVNDKVNSIQNSIDSVSRFIP